jgi:predicted  nucleic acid-binding Zn-ribbon protein
MKFEKFITEQAKDNDNVPDTRQEKLKAQIEKLKSDLADTNERIGYLNAKKENEDEKGIAQLDQQAARLGQKREKIKGEIARLKGKL